jgi:hypothetical protein
VAVLEKFKTWARTIKRDVHAIYLASGDPLVPWYAKALGVAVAAYALSPIDPDRFHQGSARWRCLQDVRALPLVPYHVDRGINGKNGHVHSRSAEDRILEISLIGTEATLAAAPLIASP